MPRLISVRSVVSMMWKFVMKHCGARGVGMSVDEEVRSWCGAIIDCPLLQEVCESCEHGAENAMWSAFRQHSLLCSRCCGACCVQQCCVVALGNDFVFVLSVVDSWGAFSWCVLCRRSFFLSRFMCGTIQIVDVRVGEMCAVNGVSIWHLFSHRQWFLHRGMASLISVCWRGLTSIEERKVHHFAWEICCLLCMFVCTSHYSMMRQMTSRTRCGSHSHLSCVTTIEAIVRETTACLDTFFLCTRCVQGVCNFFFFLRYESVFRSGQVQQHFCVRHYGVRLYGAFLMFFLRRW